MARKLKIAPVFREFVESELLPAIGFDADAFWDGVASIVDDLTPVNRELLQTQHYQWKAGGIQQSRR